MNIYILRHGQAEMQQTTDAARRLTEKGRADTHSVLQKTIARVANLKQLWASPLVRAQQTALIAQEYFPSLVVKTTELLIPEASSLALYGWLNQLQEDESSEASVLLVSHQPLVGRVINQLCGVASDYYPMSTSSLAALKVEIISPELAEFLWLQHA